MPVINPRGIDTKSFEKFFKMVNNIYNTSTERIQSSSQSNQNMSPIVAMNRQIQMRLHAKGCHSHEQGLMEPISKSI
jgi:hypothetical protein